MKIKALKAQKNKLAALGGVVMGVVLYLVLLLNYFTIKSDMIATIISFINIVMICSVMSIFAKRFTLLSHDTPVGFGQIYGFIIQLMVFAGVIYGSLYFVQSNIIDPDYFKQLQTMVVETSGMIPDKDVIKAKGTMDQLMSEPLTVIILSTISTLLYGSFLALFVAAFARPRESKGENKL